MTKAHLSIEEIMTALMPAPATELVVETDDDHYLGVLDTAADGRFWVRTGRRGHPVRLHRDDVITITPAAEHPFVEMSN